MKIGLLVTSAGNFGQKGFYNSQEVGLARVLTEYFDEVTVYKLVASDLKAGFEVIDGCVGSTNATMMMIPAKNLGANGIMDVSVLDTSLDVLVYFSDTQLSLPSVYKWAMKNSVIFLPYIGVLESHSISSVKKLIINALTSRNIRVYKKCNCLVKTPSVARELEKHGITSAAVAPVGLDLSLLRDDYVNYSAEELKGKYGYRTSDMVMLFIGRLTEEKQPVRMIEIFAEAVKRDDNYRLLMVGTGEMKTDVLNAIEQYDLKNRVTMIERIPNSDIWELYRLSDCFVNLNQQEIFGMAILEAMYYGCKVVAWTAPGPDFIIKDGVSGCIRDTNEGMVDAIVNAAIDPSVSHDCIIERFTWDNAARVIYNAAVNAAK